MVNMDILSSTWNAIDVPTQNIPPLNVDALLSNMDVPSLNKNMPSLNMDAPAASGPTTTISQHNLPIPSAIH